MLYVSYLEPPQRKRVIERHFLIIQDRAIKMLSSIWIESRKLEVPRIPRGFPYTKRSVLYIINNTNHINDDLFSRKVLPELV